MAGLVAGGAMEVLGIAAVRDGSGIEQRIAAHLSRLGRPDSGRYRVMERFAGRGFARLDAPHHALMKDFRANHGVPLDPVYTVKLFHALLVLAGEGYFARGTRVLAMHSGGLQGCRAMAPAMPGGS
jgi:1-aminocyclopropane-1-carboxylate deaminase